jgi:hypothetical protein
MEENAYITSILAGVFYLVVGVHLLRLHRRTGEWPEFWLSVTFVLAGVYYFAYNIPRLFRLDPWPFTIAWVIDWIYILSVFPYLIFIRIVFRPASVWASVCIAICSVILLSGAAMGTIEGDVVYSYGSPWFLLEWIGYTAPCVWMCGEATLCRISAQKRARLDLVQPIVVNRYLLLALFGAFEVLACLSDLSFAYDISSTQSISVASNVLLGSTEIASVAVLWLAFFPPTFYASWIARRAAIPAAAE